MHNDRGVFWRLIYPDGGTQDFDNAEAARKAARLYQAANLKTPDLYKYDPVKGLIPIMV